MVNVVEREQVGEKLPKGWKWVKLGDVGSFDSGGTPSKDNANYWGGEVPFVTGADITNFHIKKEDARAFLTDVGLNSGKTSICNPGTVLFVTRTRVGRVGIAKEVMGASQDLSPYTCGKDILPEYVCRYLLSITNHLSENCRGSTIKGLVRDFVHTLKIPLPPLPEQKRIVDILTDRLSTIDKARTATEAQLEAAKALPAAYLREVFDSPEAQKWEKKRLGDIAETCSGSTPSRERKDYYIGEIPWIKTGELRDGIIYHSEEHISTLALRETSVKLLPAKTLLVAMYGQGQTRGRTGLLAQLATTNQACFAILPNDEEFEPKYLQFWFQNSYSRLREETEGRGGNQPNLNGELLRDQIVVLPPLDAQLSIVSNLERVNEKTQTIVKSLQSQLDTINKLPAALLRQAFNGEL